MTSDDLRARRAGSFGAHAHAYAEHRPDYPAAAVRWALAPLGAGRHEVLDLGAGTGKLAGGILAEGHRVTAVEPDEAMLSELVRRHGGVRALPGTAERIPLPAATVDAVLVGQAFHWFDPDRALAEIARVLRPGGVLAALWNDWDEDVDWVARFPRHTEGLPAGTTPTEDVPEHELFHDGAQRRFRHVLRRTADTLVAMLGTHSKLLVSPPEVRQAYEERVRAFLAAEPATASGEFDVPHVSDVWRLVRR
ncbi:class I SAM-dependent methyltransferase [Saccharothrix violaceirubra]|uniref:SAM-dependent methyltransferase n=1 Tax=Saccharothrix violaceirubra TaxID=413306 RepID=A0A7W7T946_9PSEU|nr:class I SAM-dependent methyltransferase [Saccharothrix violaceirubra]MBB4968872.1 SAM-dependent methyltransferase [Saccharothrix violaceirubra]